MASLDDVGEISISENRVYWTIKDFFKMPQSADASISSPKFTFADTEWTLRVLLRSEHGGDAERCFEIILMNVTPFGPTRFDARLGILGERGVEIASSDAKFIHFTYFSLSSLHAHFHMLHSEFNRLKDEIVDRGTVLLFCEMLPTETGGKSTVQANGKLDVDDEVPLPVPMCDNKLLQDLRELLLSEEDSDITIKVKGQEYRAHRIILRARSPVFASMFRHDTKEKATGVIDVEDCEPHIFPDFLHFLYCGSVEKFSGENVFGLYTAADKYDVQGLKTECVNFMKNNLSVETFCDTITLSLQHCETELIKQAIDFFSKNLTKIIETSKWQTFIAQNPIQGNELFIKAMASYKLINP